ncbi:sigma-70 family RNA polymerase sigma factor [Microbacterium sp. YJN-G]|uniref:sigma-70 family RNA polymerase sigma factor n=1 Tax=Microbacterium sp. YJN-G TaxID=2763257 RepID=UPI0018781C4A|nr:sigma-70 family RNA polymerase sigma factor [Microbacterium sp. YJN-G]
MTDDTLLAAEFEVHRRYLTSVAYRMLGNRADAEDAVQESWLRLDRAVGVDDLRAWLTRVVSRICLDQLRSRSRRHESPLETLPDLEAPRGSEPSAQAEASDRISYALMLVLEQLAPDERLAYVLHDVFGLPFDEIADVVGRTAQSARKLASRARNRIRGAGPSGSPTRPERERRRAVVEAFLAAARDGDLIGLVGVLHPDVEFRIDQRDDGIRIVRGAELVAGEAAEFRRFAVGYSFEIVQAGEGFAVLASDGGTPSSLLFFTIDGDRITAMDARSLE